MREIKFRGKRTDNGEWVYGFYIKYKHMGVVTHIICTNWAQVYLNSHYVDPATVGQYTELKDKNGLEIYEGDILRDSEGTYVIQWFEGDARFIAICADAYILGDRDEVGEAWELIWVNCEVIGTIHDNPELLEGG